MMIPPLLAMGIPQVGVGFPWTARNASSVQSWNKMATNGSRMVALTSSGTNGMYSDNGGLSWTNTGAYPNAFWNAATFGGGKFVAVGAGGAAEDMSSADGITWVAGPYSGSANWVGVAHNGSVFLRIMGGHTSPPTQTSIDGITWSAAGLLPQAKSFTDLTYGNGLFVACSGGPTGQFAYSADGGASWTGVNAPANRSYNAITFDGTKFIAVGSGGAVATSADAITWAEQLFTANTWYAVTAYGGTVVAVSISGAVQTMSSTDSGTTWTGYVSDPASGLWTAVSYANGFFAAVSQNGTYRAMTAPPHGDTPSMIIGGLGPLYSSNNGIGWNSLTGIDSNVQGIVHIAPYWYVAGYNAKIWRSSDGISFVWTSSTAANITMLTSNGTYLIATSNGVNGRYYKSIDNGATWQTFDIPGFNYIIGMMYWNGTTWAATGNVGQMKTSTDGETWSSAVTAPGSTFMYSLSYFNGLWLAMGSGGIQSSADLVTWTTRDTTGGFAMYQCVNNGTIAVAAGDGGKIYSSTDGVTWTLRTSGTANLLYAITYDTVLGLFVAVGNGGDNVSSIGGINWNVGTAVGGTIFAISG